MQPSILRTGVLFAGVLSATVCGYAQSTPPPKDARVDPRTAGPQGLPPRTTPGEYQAHARAGAVTIAADFVGHFVPTAEGTSLSTEDFVVVETAFFGEPEAKITVSQGDFSLRINGKKQALPSQPYGLVSASLKDPEWDPPKPPSSKSKTSMGGGGEGDSGGEMNAPPPVVKVPFEVQRAMALRLQKATLPEGDRTLPRAGLIFFEYRGKSKGIHTVELIYAGPSGQTILKLQP